MSLAASIIFRDLTLGYERRPAVHHLGGTIAAASLTAVVGPNGAGKSTLLKSIAGLLRPLDGAIELHGASVAYLPQQAEIDRSFPISVEEVVMLGHWQRIGPFGALRREHGAAVLEALTAVGLDGFSRRPIRSLSAGQFQRVLFARMLLQDARLILLDEPFTAIDARTTEDLLRIVARWAAERRTVLAVLHDLDQVRAHFPETLLLAREPVAWGPTREVLTPANLARARTMSEAWDDRAAVCRRRSA
ncbi:zinc ABC transporter ATP-binding protein AztA [Arenibaculum pallidiluteum]|uniref:zinc ABC transporter ATP-binding protein AztA n=1 Tax=Arenibaculum pallidiluteum TaxID=2812559 RepID=UPI001A95C830|nr:zinc ABC transporter ATP-binding protein AztA [Arenibaculum pallidiluteum]